MSNISEIYLTPVALILLIISVMLVLILNKQYLFIPLVITACYSTIGAGVILGGFHFQIIRIVILIIFMKLFINGDLKINNVNAIDKVIFIFMIFYVLFNTLSQGTYEAFQNKLGLMYNVFLYYGFFRITVNNINDIEDILKIISIIIIPLALIMVYESRTSHNIFSLFSGVEEMSGIRDGRVRCQGPFRHAILAGTFGATLFPLYIGSAAMKINNRWIHALGALSCFVIVYTSSSSGPLVTLILSIVGLSFWYLRDNMKTVRWIILLLILTLHFIIMKAPVWYLFSRLSDTFGGTGWHRSYLIDQAVRNIGEWWLIGIKSTTQWFPYALSINNQADMTNQYIAIGTDAGIFVMILFIVIIVYCFKNIGIHLKIKISDQPEKKFFLWAIGTAVFAHVVSFFGISYFDQMSIFWWMLVGIISSVTTDIFLLDES